MKKKTLKQAETELCEAQDKLGIVKPALPSKKFRLFPLIKFEVIFQLETKFMSSFICQNIDVVVH
jgi:hypothetical protein